MCQSEKIPPSLYIQESHRERFETIVDYYFPGESATFILQVRGGASTTFSKHHSLQIKYWLLEDRVSGDLELLYRGSRDGWKASDLHANCDNKGATITVIRSSDGFIFGGFADKSWKPSGEWCKSDKAFLLSLKSPSSEVGPTKIVGWPYFSTMIPTALGRSLTHYGYDQCVRVKRTYLIYTFRILIRSASTNLWITTFLNIIHILSYRKRILIQQLCPNIRVLNQELVGGGWGILIFGAPLSGLTVWMEGIRC